MYFYQCVYQIECLRCQVPSREGLYEWDMLPIKIKKKKKKKEKEQIQYLCQYKGQEIVEKVSNTKDEGGLGLINLTERLQAIKILELLNAASQKPESDNIIYEIGIKQMAIYGTNLCRVKTRRNK